MRVNNPSHLKSVDTHDVWVLGNGQIEVMYRDTIGMIAKLYACWRCNSTNIVKNGHNASGSQQYKCKDCGARGVLEPRRGYSEEE